MQLKTNIWTVSFIVGTLFAAMGCDRRSTISPAAHTYIWEIKCKGERSSTAALPAGEAQLEASKCQGKYNGSKPSSEDLAHVLKSHQAWLTSKNM